MYGHHFVASSLKMLLIYKKRHEVYHKQRKKANKERRPSSSFPKSLSGIIATAAAKSEYKLPFA
jgi:hypothetical protein